MRFLNAVGGGIVRRVDRDVALVEEEDGFETPVLVRECVVIESGRRTEAGESVPGHALFLEDIKY